MSSMTLSREINGKLVVNLACTPKFVGFLKLEKRNTRDAVARAREKAVTSDVSLARQRGK